MKYFFLSLDLEEWYHLEYFQKYNPAKTPLTINNLSSFFNLLDKYNIKITVFVLGELIDSHIDLIIDINNRGHEIAIHGWDHNLLPSKNTVDFINEIKRTKEYLESIIKKPLIGYRAPCFSLNNEKLEALMKIGIKYDSSFIQFKEHPLYGSLNMDDFSKIDDLIYKKRDFYEFELPTLEIFSKAIPISGGGYFRLFPRFLFSRLWKRYLRTNHNFTMYIHPFELTNVKVNLKGFGFLNKIRFSVGRKNNLDKLDWFIQKCLQANFKFKTMSGYINSDKLKATTT
jgi:polysaccharide deacetylase family protein (PEP-CTERM system associated)